MTHDKGSARDHRISGLATFERLGFEQSRLIGKHEWVVTRIISQRASAF
jgi:hypothetical protein